MSFDTGSETRQLANSPRLLTTLLLVATISFGLAVRPGVLAPFLAVIVGTLAVAAAIALLARASNHPAAASTRDAVFAAAVVAFGLLGSYRPMGELIGPSTVLLERLPGLIWAVLAIVVYVSRKRWTVRKSAVISIVTLVITLIVGVGHIQQASGVGLDVLLLHTEAADALAQGADPYGEAVTVFNGAPNAGPDDVIVGYPYPPVTLFAYSLGEWSLDDPRYTSLVAWLAFLALLAWHGTKSRSRTAIYAVLLLAAMPGWPLVLRAAWTEPLSLLFLAIAYLFWRRPLRSGTFLGLALASKQYFASLAPILFLHRDGGWRRRALIAVAIIFATLGLGLLWDPQTYWQATVVFHASTPPRPESSNLVGFLALYDIAWDPPFWLGFGASLSIASLAGAFSRSKQQFFLSASLALAAAFLLASQAAANYWFLLAGLTGIVLADSKGREHMLAESP